MAPQVCHVIHTFLVVATERAGEHAELLADVHLDRSVAAKMRDEPADVGSCDAARSPPRRAGSSRHTAARSRSDEKTMTDDLPRTIENPLSGERVTFLATTQDSGGQYVRIRNETAAGARGVVPHYHLTYTEAFTVLEGRLDMAVGKTDPFVLRPGESAFVPLRTAHRFWNSSDAPAVFEVEIRPARNFEKALRAQFGLWQTGGRTRRPCRGTSSNSP
jgi:mannose-6-phosphate isomerase-like protein (cupin superfamily)